MVFLRIFILTELLCTTISYVPIVNQLKQYIETNDSFAFQVNETFIEGGYGPNSTNPITYDDMYNFWDFWITNAPMYNDSFIDIVQHFGRTPTGNQILLSSKAEEWIARWQNERKNYCDSYNSTWIIPIWEEWNEINMTQYIIPSNGFQSFNDFFSRKIKRQYRPITSPNNTNIITSPCDGIVSAVNLNNLTLDTFFTVKGETYDLCKILNNNINKCDLYENGSSIQIYLATNNYHRYHAVSNGIVDQIDIISGYEFLWLLTNSSDKVWNIFFANNNERGIMYLDTNKLGTIAHIFIGIDVVSSVNINIDVGIPINKGDNVGYFKYGGSTVLILFQNDIVDTINVKPGDLINMGQQIAVSMYNND